MFDTILDTINKFIPDKGKAKELQSELKSKFEETFQEAIKADKAIRLQELLSKGIKGKWRPYGAVVIFSTYLVRYPFYMLLQLGIDIFSDDIMLTQLESLPLEFHGLALAFLSIYSHGRTSEKNIQSALGGR